MNASPVRRPASFIPENAPFTPEQRAWLNGFFAGLVALDKRRDGAVAEQAPR